MGIGTGNGMTKGDVAIAKTFSARFLMAIMLTATACAGFLMGKLTDEAFTGLVGAAVTAYFMKGSSDDMKKTETKTEVSSGG